MSASPITTSAAEPLRVLSLGGGTQSCALALMSAAGELPRLDAIVFADTQGESPETYAYLWYLAGRMAEAEIPLYVATAGSLEAALLSSTPTSHNPTPPAHVLNPDGTNGRIGQYRCSYHYKRAVVGRVVKKLCGGRGAWKRATVEQWIGFSLDEMGRMKPADACRCGHNRTVTKNRITKRIHSADGCARCACTGFDPWQVNRWPLIEMRMRREDTIAWFAANGHPTPPRSSCWFCPNSGQDRWQALKATHPDLWERACLLDETIRNGGGFNARGNTAFAGRMYLHGSLEPLRTADLRTRAEVLADAGVHQLWGEDELGMECNAGTCFT